MTTLTNLSFSALFQRALAEWPEAIEIGEYVVYPNGNAHVPSLWAYPECIFEKYLGTDEEVIMRNLHDEIGSALFQVAKYCLRIHPADLRPETVRKSFEKTLREKIEPSSGWTAEDFQLIDAYFCANPPTPEAQPSKA